MLFKNTAIHQPVKVVDVGFRRGGEAFKLVEDTNLGHVLRLHYGGGGGVGESSSCGSGVDVPIRRCNQALSHLIDS